MAKKAKDEAQSPRKLIQDKISRHLWQEFQQLETLTGKKEFAKRLKKAAKIITQGLEFNEATPEDLASPTKPEAEVQQPAPTSRAAKSAAKKTAASEKPAAKKVAKKSASPKKPASKKAAQEPALSKAAKKKAKPNAAA